jgi:hypothetical protein
MKFRSFLIVANILVGFHSTAQTWSGDVAQIFYEKCTKCHHSGGAAPNSLMTFNEVNAMAGLVYQCINQNEMPPWPPDNNYQQYLHDRSLTSAEKTTILNWLNNGLPEGNAASTPPPPVYTNNTFLGNGDLTVQIPTYMSKALTHDDYVCFSIPTNLTQNRTIKAVEVVPGNREIVHHALVYVDPTSAENTDTIGGNCASPSNATTKLVTGYTPGATPMILPSIDPLKLGIDVGPGSSIYLTMHYPMGSYGAYDSTKVIIHFYPVGTTGVRQISAGPLIADNNFNLPANQVTNLTAQFPGGSTGLPASYSVLSVFPHMHLLGKNIKAYAFKPNMDTVKFVNVPKWNFMWQDFYFFQHMQKVPNGYFLKGEATYDNTTNNLNNPHNPPQNVSSGFNTTDEMFLVYFHYMPYQNGDENYDLNQYVNASVGEYYNNITGDISVSPNPFNHGCDITLPKKLSADDHVYIYSASGELIRKLPCINGVQSLHWDGYNEQGKELGNGVFFVSARIQGELLSKKIMKLD